MDRGDFRDLGGRREPLCLPGQKWGVTDPDIAQAIAADRVKELDARRRGIALHGAHRARVTLKEYVREHLIKKAQTGKYNPRWLKGCQLYLDRAIAFLGAGKGIHEIGVPDVQAWLDHLRKQSTRRGERMTNATLRWHLNALSNVYRRAQSENLVPPGYNPVSAMLDKPAADPEEAKWLEVPDAALLLEAARVVPDLPSFTYPLLATFLLTGGRRAEVLGLEVEDLSFDRHTITFRRNRSRGRLKTRTSQRVVPMWPQLEEILRPYVFNPDRPQRASCSRDSRRQGKGC